MITNLIFLLSLNIGNHEVGKNGVRLHDLRHFKERMESQALFCPVSPGITIGKKEKSLENGELARLFTIPEPAFFKEKKSETGKLIARKGDTWWKLANQFYCTPNDLLSLNGLSQMTELEDGEEVRIPGSNHYCFEKNEGDNHFSLTVLSRFFPPTEGEITSVYGKRLHPIQRKKIFHPGIDIRGEKGTAIVSAAEGTVTFAGWSGGYGRLIIVDHGEGLKTRYGHLQKFEVKKGQKVSQGEEIGIMGASGSATGRHLHFEVRLFAKCLDPLKFLDISTKVVKSHPNRGQIGNFVNQNNTKKAKGEFLAGLGNSL